MKNTKTSIEVTNLKRSFKSVKKESGWKGTLKLLTNPEYITHEALKGINFKIETGEFVGLIGANGAGKTTLLKILSGLIPPTSGEAVVLGYEPFDRKLEFRKQISLVMGQKAQLWWDLPALEAFDLLRAIYQIPRDVYQKRVDELTSLLDVTKLLNTQIRRLSLGERMKMEVIGAILHLPKIIYLDEPTIGLDVLAAHKLRNFLKEHNQKEGATIILTSHNMDDISQLCKRILLIKEGELIYDGEAEKLGQRNECQLKVQLRDDVNTKILQNALQGFESRIEKSEEAESTYLITIPRAKIADTFQLLFQKYRISDVAIHEPSLERIIQQIYQQ
jgi:ABC-2 type transport system ATP-binding protein